MNREQATAFLVACNGERWGLSYKLMMQTGLRPEELFGLKWGALELEGTHGICHVKEVVVRLEGGGWQFEEPKSENSYRPIMFPGVLAQELKAHRVAQLQDRMAAGTAWHDYDLVFTSVIGTPPNRADHSNQFKAICRKAGISDTFRLYDLRHTFATIGLLAEVDPKTISEELGHASVGFTLDTYTHVLKEMKQTASDKRERILSGKK
jgi:integrase